MSRALADHYRCPEAELRFSAGDDLSSDAGYFRFGSNAICYGRSRAGTRSASVGSRLHDTLEDVTTRNGNVELPFDLSEVIDNLRLERYETRNRSETRRLAKQMYYYLRPLLGVSFRKYIQRFNNRKWQHLSFPQWPVDTTVESICERLLLLSLEATGAESIPFVWFWPNGASACLMMTHDVETAEGRDFCDDLMDIDDSFGVKASFQVVPENRYKIAPSFPDRIRSRGFEFGIQDLNHDGRLYDDEKEFLRRVDLINRYGNQYGAKGFRAAVLYRQQDWYDKLQFSFDMSIPNVAHLDPQKGGCCTVMPYFIGRMTELPVTTTQDYALFHLLNDYSIDLWRTQVGLILGKNGLMSFITHPDYLVDSDARAVYLNLLAHLQDLCTNKHVWMALPSEVDSWWRARSRMSVEKIDGFWRVVGQGAERAVLAFARNEKGKLVYEVPSVQLEGCSADIGTLRHSGN